MENNELKKYILSLDAFLRSVELNKNIPLSFFLGAGASISSGIKSAEMCIWDWKLEIFLSQNSVLDRKLFDISLSSSRSRIQQWLDNQGNYPQLGSQNEYSFYAEMSFPILDDRRKYFQKLCSGKEPYVGYHYLSLLGKSGIISSVWSTNFDSFCAKAMIAHNIDVIEIGLDTQFRLNRQFQPHEVASVSLHGDYRYDSLKNTKSELQTQDLTLRKELCEVLKKTSLIVLGYSGRDDSVMETILEGFTQKNCTSRLFWCGYNADTPEPRVENLLININKLGGKAFYISTLGFDDLLERLSIHCLDGKLLEEAKKIREKNYSKFVEMKPFSIPSFMDTGLIKSNAFEIELPKDIFQFKLNQKSVGEYWNLCKELTIGKEVVAAPLKNYIFAFGNISEIKEIFGEHLLGNISRVPIDKNELTYDNGVIKSLLISALVRGFSKKFDLNSNEKNLIWRNNRHSTETINGMVVNVYDAVMLSLKIFERKTYLLLKPTIVGFSSDGNALDKGYNQELKRLLLTKQFNDKFNKALDTWRRTLLPDKPSIISYPLSNFENFKFLINKAPAFANIVSNNPKRSVIIPPSAKNLVDHKGILIEEPPLIFSNLQGNGYIQDTHQLRGILNNQPFDYALTKNGMLPGISVGVICPKIDSKKLTLFLSTMHQRVKVDSKQEYLLDYPGFSQAFGLPLDLPVPNQTGWYNCSEPEISVTQKDGSNYIKGELIKNIESLISSINPNVIFIFIPKRWSNWEKYEDVGESFDLHDFVKAYCVQKGIATQFIRESTLSKQYRCEIMWWLAQSIYTKSMRTPWILKDIDDETAFVGIGYGLDYSRGRGNHVILGCSHIYGSNGQGLKYKLSKIENPIIRRDNPFMSKDDARRVGDSIRQLFFESFHKLPQRVVIHKRNYFTKEERDGLIESLGSMTAIDMLEIQFDPMLRYVASKINNGKFSGDGFPVRRGTALVLDRQIAAIWTHGTADAITSGFKYYQGKNRIPAPLIITRHYGNSSIQSLATEILGLSKMNWNNFDLYSKLPATIESSHAIAKIGLLLDRFSNYSYDYRLFI